MSNNELVPVSTSGVNLPPPPPPPAPDVPIYGSITPGPAVKIVLLVPTNINVDIRWAISFQQLLSQLPPGSSYMMDYRYGLGETREALVTQALATIPDLTHILFVDSDVIVTAPNPIATLLSNNKPIVTGVYFNSLMTGAAAWKSIPNPDQNTKEQMPVIEAPIPVKDQTVAVHECDKIGFGFVLIQKQVFDQLIEKKAPRPWFYYTVDGQNRKMQSEDFYFLDTCREYLGIKPFVDLRVTCGHIKSVMIMHDGSIPVPPHQGQQPTGQGQK